MSDVTRILERAQAGDTKAAEELLPLIYAELRKLAASMMAKEAAGHTLQPTALKPGCGFREDTSRTGTAVAISLPLRPKR